MKGVLLGALLVCASFGQSPKFEVASVKLSQISAMGGEGRFKMHLSTTPGGLNMGNINLRTCVQWAYNLKDFQVTGPDWTNYDRYDIVAKAATPARDDEMRQMLQGLLAERFKLAVHREVRDLPVYVLTVGKNGIKMKESEGEGESSFRPVKGMGKLALAVTQSSMAQFAELLSQPLQRPVIDETGLKGRYEFTIDLAKYFGMELNAGARGEGEGPKEGNRLDPGAIETAVTLALRDQLGLKLEPKKAPIDMIVIDRAEKVPTEN